MIRRTIQMLLVGVLSGVIFLGIGGRVVMRGLAVAVGRSTDFGLGATAGIVLIGGVLGLIGGVVFALVAGRLPGSAAAKGVLFGTAFLAVLIPLQPAAVQEEIEAFRGHLVLATICFWVIFALYGFTLAKFARRSTAR
jgi:hypothetical protein